MKLLAKSPEKSGMHWMKMDSSLERSEESCKVKEWKRFVSRFRLVAAWRQNPGRKRRQGHFGFFEIRNITHSQKIRLYRNKTITIQPYFVVLPPYRALIQRITHFTHVSKQKDGLICIFPKRSLRYPVKHQCCFSHLQAFAKSAHTKYARKASCPDHHDIHIHANEYFP